MAAGRRLAAVALAALTVGGSIGPAPAAAAPAPPPSPARCDVAALHEVFLGRPASVYDLELWSREWAVAPAMARSDPWLEAVVVDIFATALDREPEPEGLAFWVGRLRARARVATTYAAVYGSEEVWARAERTPGGFVADVFPRIMGRQPSAADVDYWSGEVGRRGRGGVAKALLGSIENRRVRVADLYLAVLGRAPDSTGWEYWARRLATLDDVDLAVTLARSDEAHQQAQVGCDVPPPADRRWMTFDSTTPASSPALSDDGLWLAWVSETSNDVFGGQPGDGTLDLWVRNQTTREVIKAVDVNADVHGLAISADGRHVVFTTTATDLLPSAGTAARDVFSWDRTTGTVTRVTDGEADVLPDPASMAPTISADGRFVAFASYSRQVPVEPAGYDGFVWDRTTGTVERIEDAGVETRPIITPDGSTVIYGSLSPVAPGERPGAEDVFAWDRATGATSFVGPGVPLDGAADGDVLAHDDRGLLTLIDAPTGAVTTITRYEDGVTGRSEIATDGATVVFSAGGTGRIADDPPHTPDVFVWERATGTVLPISPGGPRGYDATDPTTSGDGRYVAFEATARQPDPPLTTEIELWDRGS